jgi:tetratricopeptide (TPR) repeat protein
VRVRGSLLPLVLAGWLSFLGGPAHRKTEKGNRLYQQGAYEEALGAYTEAQVAAPDAPELHYDIGNVLYRQGSFEESAEAYLRALGSAPPTLAPLAAYNLGNSLYEQGRYEEAIRAYVRALRQNPSDRDAKHNLELALRALRQRKPQSASAADHPSKPHSPETEGRRAGGESSRPQPTSPGRMSPDEAQRLLDRLADEERESLKREQERRARRIQETREKDW